ncbi:MULTISPECIES: alpha/beta fold hydrolase [Streptomyces]|uniref:Aminoacrylate hydrolase RutD n=1 Tax=Streptomyces griseofuscus TaxID=146922 RepID=A0A7H1QCT7_9ACTN|nr:MULTISPECIES: alpha/beta fold hydrolase [Streptomyces]MBA9050705.1 3-oxoacyl-(acyl-carrier-protein) synthase/aryl carrier-like protein [Streptomyces murinus]QNT98117.1 Putative aminoacrylate hydrolase RutD [Streptomyces griseofuscus]
MDELLEDDTPVVVGMACRFAGSDGLGEYWERLRLGRSALGTTGRWTEEEDAGSFTGGFLDGHQEFDARFFRISPNEAQCMDPQQRILLQTVQHAVDDGYLTAADLRDLDCGVFAAGLPGDYRTLVARRADLVYGTHSFLGNAPSTLSGRISYFYDVNGPSLTLDSACSSSLAALHEAALNIRAGQCRAAIVGAVSVFSTPEVLRFAQRSRMSSPEGASLPFTDAADGFVPAEGAAALVVMRHDEARARGLRVYGAVQATGTNHNGTTNGLMAPSSKAQSRLIAELYDREKIDASQIAYLETHGTGTPLGDPIELEGLRSAFRRAGADGCHLGAVKPLIGHTLVASGLASVVKALLAFHHATIPPVAAAGEAVSYLDVAPFKVNREPLPWPEDKPLCAISAFGFTGSNGHVVLRRLPDAPPTADAVDRRPGRALPFCLSAESPDSLAALADRCRTLVAELPGDRLWDLSQLLLRRPRLAHESVVVARTRDELGTALEALAHGGSEGPAPRSADTARLDDDLRELVTRWRAQDMPAVQRRLDAPADLARITLPAYPFDGRRHWLTGEAPEPAAPPVPDVPEAATDALARELCARLSALLGYDEDSDQVVPGTRIASLGLDSLSAVQLLSPYQKAGSAIKAHDLFRHETVADLAAAIGGRPLAPPPTPPAREPGTTRRGGAGPDHAPLIRWSAYGDAGRPTLLLPPLNCDERAWAQQIPALLRAGRTVYVPEYPGHNDTPFDEERFSFEALADEVAGFLRDTADGPADLVGWSLGGCVSTLTALRHPERVASLALVSCAPRYGEDAFERTLDLREELRLHGGLLEAVFGEGGNLAEKFGGNASMDVLRCYYTDLTAFDVVDRLPDITADCLVLRGVGDCVLDAEAVELYSRIPGVRVREFEDHGHYVPLTAARAVNRTLAAFWAGRG